MSFRCELATQPTGVLWYTTAQGVLAPAAGATAYVYQHVVPPTVPSVQVTVYANEDPTNMTTLSQPLTARADGSLPGYVVDQQVVDVVPTFHGTTLSPAMTNAVRADDTGGGGGGSSDPLGPALGVQRIVGPTNTAFAASATTDVVIPIPTWAEGNFSRVVVGLIITHPNISQLATTITDGTALVTLFEAGGLAANANLGNPGAPGDPDSFVYFSDFGPSVNAITATSGQDPTTMLVAPPAYPANNFIPDAIIPPATVGRSPLANLAGDTTAPLTLAITESAGSTGTLDAVIVYLISEEFDALLKASPATPAPAVVNVLNAGVKNDGTIFNTGSMAAGSPILHSTSNPFVPSDVGKLVAVSGALSTAYDHNTLTGTIVSYQSASQVTLSVAADQNASFLQFVYGTDNTGALDSLTHGRFYFPPGTTTSGLYLFGSTVSIPDVIWEGAGDLTLLLSCAQGAGVGGAGIVRDMTFGYVFSFGNYIGSPPAAPSSDFLLGGGGTWERVQTAGFTNGGRGVVNDGWGGFGTSFSINGTVNIRDCNIASQGGEPLVLAYDSLTTVMAGPGLRLLNWDFLGLGTKYDVVLGPLTPTPNASAMLRGVDASQSNGLGIHVVTTTGNTFNDVEGCSAAGIHVDAGVSHFRLRGNRCFTPSFALGIVVAAGASNYYIITDNDTNGHGVTDGGTGTHKVVTNNI